MSDTSGPIATPAHIEPLLSTLRENIDHVLQPLVERGSPVALLDFPNHSNVGDSAIWLGEAKWLADNANPRRYVCDVHSYAPDALRRQCPEGPILIHGGGNFGDLWPRQQQLRERVIRDFPDRTIIQLPQSLHFARAEALESARRVLNAHRHFTILVRDHQSHALASAAFSARVLLCPDMAFCLPPMFGRIRGLVNTVVLKRTDHETAPWPQLQASSDTMIVDWLDEPRDINRVLARAWTWLSSKYPRRFAPLAPAVADRVARERLERGIHLLTSGQSVVTDRLHAHVLCLLLGIPHTVIDNSYGKLSSFIDTWTRGTCVIGWDPARSARP